MKDLLVIREYEFNSIKLLLKVDRTKNEIGLVWFDTVKKTYVPKDWVFADRTIGYAKSWLHILDAMRQAVEAGIKELEEFEEEDMQRTAELYMAISEQGEASIDTDDIESTLPDVEGQPSEHDLLAIK